MRTFARTRCCLLTSACGMSATPLPSPPPQGGREHAEYVASPHKPQPPLSLGHGSPHPAAFGGDPPPPGGGSPQSMGRRNRVNPAPTSTARGLSLDLDVVC